MIEIEKVARALGGKRVLGRDIHSMLDMEQAVAKGLPVQALEHCLYEVYKSPPQRQGVLYRVVPRATWKRRLRSRKLRPRESEKTERLARAIATTQYVWDNDDDARTFLETPHPELGGKRPIDAAMTELGARHVEDILWAIYHGLPA